MTVRGQDRTLEEGLAKTIGAGPPKTNSKAGTSSRRRVAFYARTSSEDQRERETIKTQIEALFRTLHAANDCELVGEYYDDGVSGTLAMEDRQQGRALLAACRRGEIDEIWVTRPNRIGRKALHILGAVEAIQDAGATVVGVLDPIDSTFILTIKAAVAEEERRAFLENSRDGMNRAAEEGRYCGGVKPFGFKVVERGRHPYLEPSDGIIWGGLTEADLVQRMYHLIGVEGWSTRRVAEEFNRLKIPTAYQMLGRGMRKKAVQGVWRAGRIRNLLVNPIYRGESTFGKRTTTGRSVITARVPALVPEELWAAAQATLARNRMIPTTARRSYLLRGVVKCGLCGLHYSGSKGRESTWYRCNGQIVERGVLKGRCWARSLKCDPIDALVWADVERWLANPGDVIDELRDEYPHPGERHDQPSAETLRVRLSELAGRRANAARLAFEQILSDEEVRAEVKRIGLECSEIEARLAALEAQQRESVPQPDLSLLDAVRARIPSLTFEEKQQIVKSLVKAVTVHTSRDERGRKELRVVIEYQFPAPDGVVLTCTGKGSSPR